MLGLRWPTRRVQRDCHYCGQTTTVERAQIADWQCTNPLCGQRNISQNDDLVIPPDADGQSADIFTTRIPSTPVESPFCPRCEASLQASLDFRSNYHIGDSDEAYRIFQWDVQAYERSHPLACLICEPKIKRIIENRDSKMREKIWADATLSHATQESDDTPDLMPASRLGRTMRDFGVDVDLWTWRVQCLAWILGTFTFYSVGLVGTSNYAIAGLVLHRISRSWLPWWPILRFREERMFGEDKWQECERIVLLLRSAGIVMRIFPFTPTTTIVLILEIIIRVYALSSLRLVSLGSISPNILARKEPYEITLGSLMWSVLRPIMTGAARPLTISLPRRNEKRNDIAEEMDWEPETPGTATWITQPLETPRRSTRRTVQALTNLQSRLTSPVVVPPSPLDDWTRFKTDILTETTLNAKSETSVTDPKLMLDDRIAPSMRNITAESFRTAYAFSALLRVLAMINALAIESSGTVGGMLADGSTTMEMIASVGASLVARSSPQEPTTSRQTTVMAIQAIHCLHVALRIISANAKPLRIIWTAANKHNSLVWLTVAGELFWITIDVLIWLAL